MKKIQSLPVTVISAIMLIGLAVSCQAPSSSDAKVSGNAVLSVLGSYSAPAPRAVSVPSISFDVKDSMGNVTGVLTLETARAVLTEFELEQEGATADGVSFDFEGPYLVDIVQGTVTPEIGASTLAEGSYTQLKFKIDKVSATDEEDASLVADLPVDDPIIGYSMILEGSYTPDVGSIVPVSIKFTEDAEIEINPAGTGIAISNGTLTDIVVAFRLGSWFKGIDFTAVDQSVLKENIKNSVAIGEDEDDDGLLEDSETVNLGDDNGED